MKIALKVENDNTVETIQYEIKKANIKQITDALKIINDAVKSVEKNEELKGFVAEMAESLESMKDEEFGIAIVKSIPKFADLFLVHLPEKATELLATLSGIEHDTLVQQDPLDVMDIYDAVLEVNDMERLIERGKKSLAATKSLSKVIKLPTTRQATQAAQQ